MLSKRILVLIFLIPACVGFIALGGWYFAVFMAIFLAIAAWEWGKIFQQGDNHPSVIVMILGVVSLVLSRMFTIPHLVEGILAANIFLATLIHLIQYEKGRNQAATDFTITICGIVYLGWLGGHFIMLRDLPNGLWWMLLAIPAIWIADAGAYLIGRKWGKHKLSSRASPNKSWEGYIAGIISATLLTPLIAYLWSLRVPDISMFQGLIIGLVVSILAPLGDLGESMIKRQFHLKDSSHLLPGHGGILDRFDSWLWAVPIAYYSILLLFT
jgi:phosphatidate cytidylyltransferase